MVKVMVMLMLMLMADAEIESSTFSQGGKVGEWQNQGEDVSMLRDGEALAEASC